MNAIASTAAPSITVLTATLNAAKTIGVLARSLQQQSDTDFYWLVVDGGSSDGTVQAIESLGLANVEVLRTRDFGIYDALNQGLARLGSDYYIVCGADDHLFADCIAGYRAAVRSATVQPDFVAAPVSSGGRLLRPRRGWGWLYGLEGETASHSVGLLIRTALHATLGPYSRALPIAADQEFVLRALRRGASILYLDKPAGDYGRGGTSGRDPIGTILEIYRVQLLLGRNGLLQTLLLLLRLLKNLGLR
jgi:glycosyltransferase involved in cell wall biosynthesis